MNALAVCDLCCTSNDATLISSRVSNGHVHAADVKLLLCRCCGVVFLDPAAEIPRGSEYWESHSSAKSKRPTAELLSKLRARAGAIHARLVSLNDSVGTLLDIGAGTGAVLETFHSAGWRVTGIEPSEDYAEFVRERCTSATVICARFEAAALPDASFDLVTMSHVLEHAESPTRFLTIARRLVHPSGLLYVEVPDLMAIPWQSHLWEYAELAHRFYFTEQTLTACLAKTGWRPVSIERTQPGNHLAVFAAPTTPSDEPFARCESHFNDVRTFLRFHALRRPLASICRSLLFQVVGPGAARKLRDRMRATGTRGAG